MSSRTALVLETNPVITERYIEYTGDSNWRIMLKDTLNDFLEKLQQEKFDLIVAEESLLPQGIIQMMKSTGIPFLLSTNNKNPEIPTLPRNFNRTELLTVFDRLVPYVPEEPETEDTMQNTVVDDLLSGLEDEEEAFELTPDAVVPEPEKPHEDEKKDETADSAADFFGDGGLFGDDGKNQDDSNEDAELFETLKPAIEVSENKKSGALNTPSFNESDIDSFVDSLSLEKEAEKPAFEQIMEEKTLRTALETRVNDSNNDSEMLFGNMADNKPSAAGESAGPELSDDVIKAAVSEWLEKNARSIIKEIVLEQLESLSGKNDD